MKLLTLFGLATSIVMISAMEIEQKKKIKYVRTCIMNPGCKSKSFNHDWVREYTEASQKYPCTYINKLRKSHTALDNFLKENQSFTIILIGEHWGEKEDFSLIDYEARVRQHAKKYISCAII